MATPPPEPNRPPRKKTQLPPGPPPPAVPGTAGQFTTVLPVTSAFEIVTEIGQGATGVVYEARQIGLDRPVALKMLRQGVLAGSQEVARFRNEARCLSRLDHPNIVRLYTVCEYNGLPCFALEYVDAGSLAERLARGPLTPAEAARLLEKLARAIHHAHERGIIHRDLKPRNILLTGSGDPRITDFGIARDLTCDERLTLDGTLVGTPAYMAPEQTFSNSPEVGPATDVHALGVILYEALTGRPPFRGATTLDTLMLIRRRPPVPPSRRVRRKLGDLEIICLTCLKKSPQRRYGTALDLADDLARYLRGEPLAAIPTSV